MLFGSDIICELDMHVSLNSAFNFISTQVKQTRKHFPFGVAVNTSIIVDEQGEPEDVQTLVFFLYIQYG